MNPAYFVSLCEWMNKWQRHTVLFTNVITYTEARARAMLVVIVYLFYTTVASINSQLQPKYST